MGLVNLPLGSTNTGTNDWSDVYNNDAAIVTEVNGNLVNANVKSDAAIAHSKLANATAGQLLIANGSGVITATTLANGALDGSGNLTNITNAAIKSDAAIAGSKLDTGDGRLVQTTGVHESGLNLTLTSSYQDVPSATTAFTPDVACYALVTAAFCFNFAGVGSGEAVTAEGTLTVDGAPQTPVALAAASDPVVALTLTATQVYRVALAAGGSRTLKLQAKKSNEAGSTTVTALAAYSRFIYQLVAQ